jgi:hypothetical protein
MLATYTRQATLWCRHWLPTECILDIEVVLSILYPARLHGGCSTSSDSSLALPLHIYIDTIISPARGLALIKFLVLSQLHFENGFLAILHTTLCARLVVVG